MARVAALLLLAGALSSVSRPALASDPSLAQEFFREGNRAFAEGDLHEAYDAYQRAWSLHQSFDIACNLGRTEAELELHVPAAEHLDYCLRTFSTSGRGELREVERKYRELYQGVRAKVAALRVVPRPLTAEVLVDGVSMGSGPFERDIFVAPGSRHVVVRAKGYRQREIRLAAQPGASHSLVVSLELESGAIDAAPSPAREQVLKPRSEAPLEPETPVRHADLRTALTLIGTGFTFAGLAVGTAFLIDAENGSSTTRSLLEETPESGCPSNSRDPRCVRYRSSLESENDSRNVAEVAFTAAGIAGAATFLLWMAVPDQYEERKPAIAFQASTSAASLSFSAEY